ncbi:MAG: hypothetical protein OXG58_01875 [Gemmatimonadetes bacterium]|nr:hypothetical protein [Gemmatimonadota bacterium]
MRGSAIPYLLIADDPQHTGRIRVLGPPHGNRPIQSVSAELLADSLQQLTELPAFDAIRRIADDLTRIGGDGLTVNGLLTRHTLEYRFKGDAARWETATDEVRAIKPSDSWQHVLRKLGYTVQQLRKRGYLARHQGRPVALIHPKGKARDLARVDSQGRPPEGLLLSDCEAQGAQFGILVQGSRFRLFDARSASPASDWLEMDIRLLGDERLPFLALLAPSSLADGGFAAVRNEARNFGVALHERLDRTIRQDALPALAVGMQHWAREHGMDLGNDRERQELERAALTLVFRIVFILFCESARHLPMSNRTYEKVSLSSLVREAHDTMSKLSSASSALWSRFVTLVRAMRDGNPAWDVPAYNGALFAARDFDGAELLERLELRDPVFAKVLVAIGQDQETRRGADFSTLEIAHIGHTYESLLSLKLSLAKRSVRYDARRDRYVQARGSEEAEVNAGGLLWQTHQGGRKAGGVYYTPVEIVRHLVGRTVLPAYERHLGEVAEIAKTDPERAASHLLSFAVVDPACGSAHFLVQVAETLAERTVLFLAEHPLPPIVEAMDRLRSGASPGVEIDDMALLRRLLVKHCVFGVDVSPMGAEVATLSLWLASFVPGLSLSYLGRNVRVGDSLIGVADANTVVKDGTFFTEQVRRPLERATEIVRALAQIDDRTPEEVAESRQADHRATRATAGLKRLFDLWTAEQFGLSESRQHVALYGAAVIEGMDDDRKNLKPRAQELAAKHRFLHWPLAFPQVFSRKRPGFDVVVGNPPWEEITVEELSFYGMYRPGLNSISEKQRDAVISELVAQRPELPQILRDQQADARIARAALATGDYKSMGSDPDLYKYFCQRWQQVIRDSGFVGVVLPRTAFNAKGSQGFREWLYSTSTTHRIDFLVNTKAWAFADVTPKYTIALVTAEGTRPKPDHRVEVLGTAASAKEWRVQASRAGVRIGPSALGSGLETPLLRSQDEADLLARLRQGFRFPYGAGGRWPCFGVRELDETNDKRFWRDQSDGEPLWKGESFGQYDPHGTGERACPVTQPLLKKIRKSRPGLRSLLARDYDVATRRRGVRLELGRARVAFHDVARGTDPRTIIACLIPPGVLLTNTAPYLTFLSGDPTSQAGCLGFMNSLSFDWQARRFIEIHANFFLLEGLYLPDPDDTDFDAVARAAARLSAVDDRFADFASATGVEYGPVPPTERTRLRVEIDARVARAWNLTRADLGVIFRDFTESAVTPAYRSALLDRLEQLT